MTKAAKLTRNETLVLDTLRQGAGPLTAYQILDVLRPEGIKAPLQVYRALRALSGRHLIHRLESQNAFVACAHDHHGDHRHAVIFLVCNACQKVREAVDKGVDASVMRLADAEGFAAVDTAIEIRGLCPECQAAGADTEHYAAAPAD
jgi:Fur family transcriptional regulator, zinc uptake regulator